MQVHINHAMHTIAMLLDGRLDDCTDDNATRAKLREAQVYLAMDEVDAASAVLAKIVRGIQVTGFTNELLTACAALAFLVVSETYADEAEG